MEPTSFFNPSLCREMAGLCARAYREESLQTDLAHALVSWAPDRSRVVVAFRGSAAALDWFLNIDALFVEQPFGRLHGGFWPCAHSIVDQIAVLDQRVDKADLYITGHSKGGAVALIVAQLLALQGWVARGVYVFGCPRVGDGAWRASYLSNEGLAANTWRITNQEDIVARLPSWVHGYRHVGSEVFVPAIGGARIRPPLWFKIVSDLAGTYREWTQGRIAQAADHPMQRYLDAVGKL